MNPKKDTQPKHPGDLECLGTISSNCSIVDRLRGSIKYHSRTRALLRKGPETIDVFTWPGAQAGHVDEPLASVLKQLLVGPIGTVSTELNTFLTRKADEQTSVEISYPTVLMDATVVASPTPIPTLTVILILFAPKDQSAGVLRMFDESNIEIQNVEGYCPEKCGGVPHLSHVNNQRSSVRATLICGCKTPLLTHQQQALEFILRLESPESNLLSAFWDSPTCEWLKHSFNNSMNTAGTSAHINHRNQGAILADDMGLGKTLTSLALIASTKNEAESFAETDEQNAKATLVICPLSTLGNWEAEIQKHLEPRLIKYVVYHGDERKKWTRREIWAKDVVLVTYDTVANQYQSECNVLFGATWFRAILDEAQ